MAYAEGRLNPAEQQEVELHLEADPLLNEAVDGLRQEGAVAGLKQLRTARPRVGHGRLLWWAGGGLVLLAFVASVLLNPKEKVPEYAPIAQAKSDAASSDAGAFINAEEVTAAVEQPESLRIGHERQALHTRTMSVPVLIRDSVERIQARPADLGASSPAGQLRKHRRERSSRQLLFLHDLKLAHPQELYATDPVVQLSGAGVNARYSDRDAQERASKEALTMAYTDFMNEALGHFASNDHKRCIDDLRFLLDQYPDDVNALFYAGLCMYNLALYDRARVLLHRAAVHPVDVFDEEAAWYHALTLDRLGEKDAAREAFARIAADGGFYAEQAERAGQGR